MASPRPTVHATPLLQSLAARFRANPRRHPDVAWEVVAARLAAHPTAIATLTAMEASGGEPDVTAVDATTGAVTFTDCAPESPTGRRSLCYDRAALDARKEAKPAGSAMEAAQAMGAELLTEAQYRALQTLGAYDLKTSSWIATPSAVRALGGALFCDRRYDQVFTYHNGAQSYYAARGFRVQIRV
jgi:hypothetical protein